MHVSIRDCMLGGVRPGDPFGSLRELGLSSFELDVSRDMEAKSLPAGDGAPWDLSHEEGRAALREALSENGVSICGILMTNDFSSADLEGETRWLQKTCELAADLAVPAVRIDLICRNADMEEKAFIAAAGSAIADVLAGTTGVELGIENHGSTSNRREFMDAVLDVVASDRLGVTLDTGNFYWYGYPLDEVYDIMEHFASRVKHTHVKNIAYPPEKRNERRETGWQYGQYVCPIYEGDVDHARVVSILRKGGYDRGLAIEDESLGKFPENERVEVLKKDADYLRSLL